MVILIGAYLQYVYCCGGCGCTGNSNGRGVMIEGETANKSSFQNFSIKDGDFSLTSTENFNFLPSSFALIQPIGEELSAKVEEVKKLYSYLPTAKANNNNKIEYKIDSIFFMLKVMENCIELYVSNFKL